MNERVLVTGASGRVGRSVVAHLAGAGYRVLAHDRHPVAHPAGVTTLPGDLTDIDAGVLRGVASVVHLAAIQSWRDERAPEVMDVNVMGTFHLLRAAVAARVRRVVFASSGEVYPETAPQRMPIDEAHPRRPTNHYGLSKVIGEEMLAYYRRRYGLAAVTLRLCHVLDPAEILDPDATGEGPRRFFLAQRLRQEEARGDEERARLLRSLQRTPHDLLAVYQANGRPARMGFLTPPDIAVAVQLAIETPAADGETLGIGPDEPVDLARFAHRLGEAAGLPVVDATLPGADVDYWTLNCRAREILGFRPQTGYDRIVELAAQAWRARREATVSG